MGNIVTGTVVVFLVSFAFAFIERTMIIRHFFSNDGPLLKAVKTWLHIKP